MGSQSAPAINICVRVACFGMPGGQRKRPPRGAQPGHRHNLEHPTVAWKMHRVGVSAPDIAGADESNLPAPESFHSTVAYFESASSLIRPVPPFRPPSGLI